VGRATRRYIERGWGKNISAMGGWAIDDSLTRDGGRADEQRPEKGAVKKFQKDMLTLWLKNNGSLEPDFA